LHPTLVSNGWEEIIFEKKRRNLYAVCGLGCIEINTNSSVSMIGKLVAVDLGLHPILNWSWKIGEQVTQSNLSVKGEDDRAIAVYVTFPYNSGTATLSEKLMRPLVEIWRGSDAPSRAISYVWTALDAPGGIIKSPYFGESNVMIIARNVSDPVNSWITERVDIVADHERVFGFTPTIVTHLMISADSDDTETKNQVAIKGFRFTGDLMGFKGSKL
jgi:hypothetical protein